MKTLYAKHKWMQIVFGALFITAGILVIVFSLNNKEQIAKILSIVLAISLFLFGATCIFSGVFSLKDKYFDPAFIYGDLAIAIGVVLCVHSQMIGDFIVVFVGTILTTIGVVYIGEATAMIFFKRPKISIAAFYLLGAAFLTLGILSYCFQEEAQTVVYVGVGGIMALVGLIQVVFGIYSAIKAKRVADEIKQQTNIHPDAIDVTSQSEVKELENHNKTDA